MVSALGALAVNMATEEGADFSYSVKMCEKWKFIGVVLYHL